MGVAALSYLCKRFSLSDEQVMLRVQKRNDTQAFGLLVRRWEGWTRRFCGRLAGDAHKGEDLAQEVFMQVFAHRGDYRHEGPFAAFLQRIAFNICCDEHRRRKRLRESSLSEAGQEGSASGVLASPAAAPDDIAVGEERAEAVRRAVFELPEQYRQVVILRHYQGLRFREIAELLDLPQGTVRSRMAEALNRLGGRLRAMMES
ncbi:MAG: RNA polymerase sigma factor [Phycisphaerales bacterium]|nr:MAG: RNA polymerase sigma factor [Phycisphaerales bacterium]